MLESNSIRFNQSSHQTTCVFSSPVAWDMARDAHNASGCLKRANQQLSFPRSVNYNCQVSRCFRLFWSSEPRDVLSTTRKITWICTKSSVCIRNITLPPKDDDGWVSVTNQQLTASPPRGRRQSTLARLQSATVLLSAQKTGWTHIPLKWKVSQLHWPLQENSSLFRLEDRSDPLCPNLEPHASPSATSNSSPSRRITWPCTRSVGFCSRKQAKAGGLDPRAARLIKGKQQLLHCHFTSVLHLRNTGNTCWNMLEHVLSPDRVVFEASWPTKQSCSSSGPGPHEPDWELKNDSAPSASVDLRYKQLRRISSKSNSKMDYQFT